MTRATWDKALALRHLRMANSLPPEPTPGQCHGCDGPPRSEEDRLSVNRNGLKLRICTGCKIRHYENCESCFGFGVWSNGTPITAGKAERYHDTDDRQPKPCPECGSDINGIPKETP